MRTHNSRIVIEYGGTETRTARETNLKRRVNGRGKISDEIRMRKKFRPSSMNISETTGELVSVNTIPITYGEGKRVVKEVSVPRSELRYTESKRDRDMSDVWSFPYH